LFKVLKDYLNDGFELYIREWFPNAIRVSNTTYKTGDFNDTKPKNRNRGSLILNIKDKYAKDFNTGESAGDIIAIYAKRFCNGDNKQAFNELVNKYNLEYLFPENHRHNNSYPNNPNSHNNFDSNNQNHNNSNSSNSNHNNSNVYNANNYNNSNLNNNNANLNNQSYNNPNSRNLSFNNHDFNNSRYSSYNSDNLNPDNSYSSNPNHSNYNSNNSNLNNNNANLNNQSYNNPNSRNLSFNNPNSYNTNNHNKYKPTQEDIDKDNKLKSILSKIEDYRLGDPVDLYLKSRGITKYSPDTKVLKLDKMSVMVNIALDSKKLEKDIKNRESNYTYNNKFDYDNYYYSHGGQIKNNSQLLITNHQFIAGIQEIFLTKDGKKRQDNINNNIPNKVQRCFGNSTISGNPVRLQPKGKNNGFIYITEGVENGLSLQEYINNEVWCSLSIVNIPTLPFENDKIYIIVFDNDLNKIDKYGNRTGKQNLERTIDKLSQLKNKHILYLLPEEEGKDANDLLREKLKIENGKLKINDSQQDNNNAKQNQDDNNFQSSIFNCVAQQQNFNIFFKTNIP
jgi:hypothetical protein